MPPRAPSITSRPAAEDAREDTALRIAEEHRFARHLLEQLIRPDASANEAVRTWIGAGRQFGGDAFAMAHTPGNTLCILLADAAGRGLAAAISVVPIVESFYAMVEKGYAPASIVRELNRKAHRLLPREHFVAAALAAIDPDNHTVQLWNGGLPELLFVDDHGVLTRVWRSRHPPLGVLPDTEFDSSCESYSWTVSGDLLMCSNGVPARQNADGIPFGMRSVSEAFARPHGTGRFQLLTELLESHGAHAVQTDDAVVIAARCDHQHPWVKPQDTAAMETPVNASTQPRWRLSLRLGAAELKALDVLPLLMGWLDPLQIPVADRSQIFLILGELFNNALDHGVLRLDSGLKREPEGFARYLDERAARLAALTEGSIEISLERVHRDDADWLDIRVEDSGAGFDVSALSAATAASELLPSGRGIALVRRLAQCLTYNARGNVAQIQYKLN